MTRRLLRITAQIEQLQRQAARLKAKEVAGVIARIKEAIEYYNLSAVDLGLATERGRKGASASKKGKRARKSGLNPRGPAVIRYRNGEGNTWSGRGRTPAWFKAALEAGATRDSLKA